MSHSHPGPVPITAAEAAKILHKSPVTIRTWVTRYSARRVGRVGRVMYYDLRDLKIIEREIFHGHQIPATPEDRALIAFRCPLKDTTMSARTVHAA